MDGKGRDAHSSSSGGTGAAARAEAAGDERGAPIDSLPLSTSFSAGMIPFPSPPRRILLIVGADIGDDFETHWLVSLLISGVLALFVSHSPGLKRAEYLNCLYSTATVPLLLCRS